ncbi:hypothetical protein F5888DRAFT_104529 [Russula emetica]|nr:hypothetical protein F5888DRAFT_104529 [Russula emetica]
MFSTLKCCKTPPPRLVTYLLLVPRMLAHPDSSGDSVVLLKMWLIIAGIYIWEFVTGLHYEWDIIRGRQTYRWTIWVYLITRWSTIMVVILILISFTVTSPMNCQAWVWTSWGSAFLGQGPGSLLLVLRIFAVWNRNKRIIAIAATIWVTNVSLLLLGVVRIRSVWDPAVKSCIVTNVDVCKISIVSNFVADTILLLIMLAGLLRLRRRGGGTHMLWDLLWKQGVIWFVVATFAEFPPAVFMILNLNDVLDMMFLFPSLIMMVIATTRMYRSLRYFSSFSSTYDLLPINSSLHSLLSMSS